MPIYYAGLDLGAEPVASRNCGKCGETKPLSEFARNRGKKHGLNSFCKTCACAVSKAWYQKNLERRREWRQKNAAALSEADRRGRKTVRDAAFAAYGGYECACCGETEPIFLAIDHINNDGAEHRKKEGRSLYHWLKKNDYPPGFQVLCHNCNVGKHINGGVCPHEQARVVREAA